MSDLCIQLFETGVFGEAVWATIYMTVISSVISYVLGLPLGVLLYVTDKGGIKQCIWLNRIVGVIVNILRSIPFIILMFAFLPVARAIVGTAVGNKAMIVMLIFAATPYIARMVESSLKEVDAGVIEAAKSMGANTFELIVKVILPEAKPSLIIGAVISVVTIIGYTAMSATIGGTGLGQVAQIYGYTKNKQDIIWLSVLFIVIIVQIFQELGMLLAKFTDKRIRINKKTKKEKSL